VLDLMDSVLLEADGTGSCASAGVGSRCIADVELRFCEEAIRAERVADGAVCGADCGCGRASSTGSCFTTMRSSCGGSATSWGRVSVSRSRRGLKGSD